MASKSVFSLSSDLSNDNQGGQYEHLGAFFVLGRLHFTSAFKQRVMGEVALRLSRPSKERLRIPLVFLAFSDSEEGAEIDQAQ